MPSWRLVNAAEIAAENRYTFYRPSAETLRCVAVGEVVKLIFEFDSDDPDAPGAERMWVQVESLDGQGAFTGRLDNQPAYIKDLSLGDPVAFRDIHIINTEHDDNDDDINLVERYLPRCIVSRKVLYDGAPVGHLYREEPRDEQDSGWTILAGDESDEYLDDADNFAYVSLGAVLGKDDRFLAVLDAPVGATFAWDEDAGSFLWAEEDD